MARPERRSGAGRPRAGLTRRTPYVTPRRSNARRDMLAFGGVAALGVLVLLIVAALGGFLSFGGPNVSATPTSIAVVNSPTATPTASSIPTASPNATLAPTVTPTPSSTASPTPTRSPSPTLGPTASPSPSPSPTLPPTPSAPPSPSPSPTLAPTVAPSPIGTIGPAIPPTGFVIVEPANGTVVSESVVIVRGVAAPGTVITRVIPLWFDEHSLADAVGRWSFAVALGAGENALTFRVGDDDSTAQTLTLHYLPS